MAKPVLTTRERATADWLARMNRLKSDHVQVVAEVETALRTAAPSERKLLRTELGIALEHKKQKEEAEEGFVNYSGSESAVPSGNCSAAQA